METMAADVQDDRCATAAQLHEAAVERPSDLEDLATVALQALQAMAVEDSRVDVLREVAGELPLDLEDLATVALLALHAGVEDSREEAVHHADHADLATVVPLLAEGEAPPWDYEAAADHVTVVLHAGV
tara:strand:- start:260 stop:646 length:387 start_codon:yes stop_codon:yes gene_type:complete